MARSVFSEAEETSKTTTSGLESSILAKKASSSMPSAMASTSTGAKPSRRSRAVA